MWDYQRGCLPLKYAPLSLRIITINCLFPDFLSLLSLWNTAVRRLGFPPWAPHQRGNGRHVNTLYSRLQKLHGEPSRRMITSLQSLLRFYSSININFNKSVWLYIRSVPLFLFRWRRTQPRGWVSVICWMLADLFVLRAWNSLQKNYLCEFKRHQKKDPLTIDF